MRYKIQHVTQQEYQLWFTIRFRMHDFSYRIRVDKPTNEVPFYVVREVKHENYNECPLCKENGFMRSCQPLVSHLPSLFDEIISQNHLRLEWLFRKCVLNG